VITILEHCLRMRPIYRPAFLLAMLVLCPIASAQLCVDARNLTGIPDGTAAKPFRTVQAAVNAATAGQTVLVATGTYDEDVRVENKAVTLMGGYLGGSSVDYVGGTPGDFTTRSIEGTPTTLDGTGLESVVTLLEAGASVVDGFRITGGRGSTTDLPFASNGGGIFARGGAPIVRNNVIDANDPRKPGDVSSFGGGIYSSNANITIENNDILENFAVRGAGIAAIGGTVIIRDNAVHGNEGNGDHGGGIYVGAPSATITRNRVYENEIGRDLGYGWGGGILIFNQGNHADLSFNEVFNNYAPGLGAGIFVDEGATAVLNNEIVHHNQVNPGQTGGGAVYVDGGEINGVPVGSEVSIINCTIAENPVQDAYLGGNGLFVEGNSTVTVRNSILWGNGLEVWFDDTSTVQFTYSNVAENVLGTGNINIDPLFADAANGDFHLKSAAGRWDPAANGGAGGFVQDAVTSPSIDTGDPADSFASEPAPNGGRINMGAYGNTPEASLSSGGGGDFDTDLNDDNAVDAVDVQLVINGALGLGDPADVNNDGPTDAVDVQLVINSALGL
jgi:hypothetical protein